MQPHHGALVLLSWLSLTAIRSNGVITLENGCGMVAKGCANILSLGLKFGTIARSRTTQDHVQEWILIKQMWEGILVQPKMTMPEIYSYFMGTLGTPHIGIMAGVAYKDFRELMDAGDRIEILTKAGKLSIGEGDNNGNKKNVPLRKKESEVNQEHQQQQWTSQYTSPEQTPAYQVNNVPQPYNYTRTPHADQPRPYVSNHTNPLFRQTYNQNRSASVNAQAQPNPRPNTFFLNLPPFPKLAISNAELFQQLVDRHLLPPYPVRPIESNFPHWYNANLTCSYHMDVAGHSIEDCEQFKMAVRKLMDCGKLEFEDEVRPDISKNPISNHNQRINVIAVEKTLVKRVSDLRVSMQCLFDTLEKTLVKRVSDLFHHVKFFVIGFTLFDLDDPKV
ncbi:hypothetical protein Lal_00049991 [Lupinus albus]|nr:hypothetical protein Lal_00049991 [Lupinus albus]